MISTSLPHGLRVVGSASGTRDLVSWDKVRAAYAAADEAAQCHLPAFVSAFAYDDAMRHHISATGSTRDFPGNIGLRSILWDIDHENLDDAIRDASKLTHYIADRFGDPIVSFSGRKGFHVELLLPVAHENPKVAALFKPSPSLHHHARQFALEVADYAGVVVDKGVYGPVQLVRAPNSRHPGTGLHKILVDHHDLPHMAASTLKALAIEPLAYDWPAAPTSLSDEFYLTWELAGDHLAESQSRRHRHDEPGGEPRIGKTTWALLTDPTSIEVGERHRTVFSAAANLGMFSSVEALVTALLTGPALDTGLTPAEVQRQIKCGLWHTLKDTDTTTEKEATLV